MRWWILFAPHDLLALSSLPRELFEAGWVSKVSFENISLTMGIKIQAERTSLDQLAPRLQDRQPKLSSFLNYLSPAVPHPSANSRSRSGFGGLGLKRRINNTAKFVSLKQVFTKTSGFLLT